MVFKRDSRKVLLRLGLRVVVGTSGDKGVTIKRYRVPRKRAPDKELLVRLLITQDLKYLPLHLGYMPFNIEIFIIHQRELVDPCD